MRVFTALYTVLLLSVFSKPAFSQQKNIRFEKIGYEAGLSSTQTTCVFQDHQGFIWIGTTFGLNRFDGINCNTYYHNSKDSNSLVRNQVLSIAEDSAYNLWIGTQEGVSCLDAKREKFTNYSSAGKGIFFFPKEFCHTYVDKENNIWIGHNNGVSLLQDRTKLPLDIALRLQPPGVITNKFVTSFLEDSKSRFWISTSYGIKQIDRKTMFVTDYLVDEDKRINSCQQISEDRKGRLFAGTWGAGILLFDERLNRFIPHFLPPGNNSNNVFGIFPITEKDTDYLLLSSGIGLLKLKTSGLFTNHLEYELYKPDKLNEQSISSSAIGKVIRDRAGCIWIPAENGLNKIDPGKQGLQTFALSNDQNSQWAPIIVCDDLKDKNSLWVATERGLFSFNKIAHRFTPVKLPVKSFHLFSMIKGTRYYWLATSSGLLQCDWRMRVIKTYRAGTSPQNLNTDRLYSLCEDHAGNIWIGTIKKGINVLNPATGIINNFLDDSASRLLSSYVNKIVEDRQQNIWIGSTNGLYRYSKNKNMFELFLNNTQPGFNTGSDNILCLQEDSKGNIWIGSRQGLRYYNYNNNRFTDLAIADHKMSDFVNGIIEDGQGFLWLATNNGLLQLDPGSNALKLYNTSDGLPQNDCTFAFEKDSENIIYSGAAGKLIRLNPAELVPNKYTAAPIITGVAIDNNLVAYSVNNISLRHDQSVGINFVSLNYTNSANNKYAYKLSGFNTEWIDIGNKRDILFPGLPPGTYTLELKAANNEGIWDRTITRIGLVVSPPFWKTWWFIALIVLLIAGILYFLYRYRVQQLIKEEKLRSHIATDLHDDIGATLSSISFYSETIKQQTTSRLPQLTPLLDKMGETSREMVGSMSDIVWAINPKNDSFEKMLSRMQNYSAELCAIKNVQLHFYADEKLNILQLSMEQRRNIYLIFKEALNNALKYGEAGNINIELKNENRLFVLSVSDDGKGFDEATVTGTGQGGNGLKNIRHRAIEIKGQLTIRSEENKGTEILFKTLIT